jgi:GT2 family glycosyltransferase
MNDAAVIEQALAGLRRQSRSPDAILIVDNASTDGTLDRTFPENVTVIRNAENQGTSGAVRTGLAYGSEHGFDWVWIFDADSVPEPDVLENLLVFFERLPLAKREQVCFLAGRPLTEAGEIKEMPVRLEGRWGMTVIPLQSAEESTECDCMIWSGSLYRTAAVEQIGLPSADYVLDIAEIEYGYRSRQLGFTGYIVHNSVVYQDVGRGAGNSSRIYRLGPLRFRLSELAPARCYYSVRNLIYFILYQSKPRRMSVALRAIAKSFVFTFSFIIRPVSHQAHLFACIRGIRDGLTSHMERRY